MICLWNFLYFALHCSKLFIHRQSPLVTFRIFVNFIKCYVFINIQFLVKKNNIQVYNKHISYQYSLLCKNNIQFYNKHISHQYSLLCKKTIFNFYTNELIRYTFLYCSPVDCSIVDRWCFQGVSSQPVISIGVLSTGVVSTAVASGRYRVPRKTGNYSSLDANFCIGIVLQLVNGLFCDIFVETIYGILLHGT